MRVYKHISFCEGINCTLAEFKKAFAPHLKKLSEAEVKEAHKVVTKKKADGKLSDSTEESTEANATKGK